MLVLSPLSQASELELLINMLHENGMVSDDQYGRLMAELNQNKKIAEDARVYERGQFGTVTPKNRVGQGGIGVWDLTLRYSSLDLNDRDILGGEMDLFNVGVNWFPVPMLRFSADYIDVLKVKEGPNDGQKPSVFLVRSQ